MGIKNKNTSSFNDYSEYEGKILLKLAHMTIAKKLGIIPDKKEYSSIKGQLEDDIYEEKQGVFVTLHINGELRGCIGNLESDKSVKNGVRENAINSAFNDPRFTKLTLEEFKSIDIEISILSKPIKLEYSDVEDLLSKLKPNIHGIIIKKSWANATFLPQVWDQLPDTKDFLSHLCKKAGLSSNEWKKGNLDVMTYTVQYFEGN